MSWIATCAMPGVLQAAELAVLNPNNWQRLVPQGKEVDAIYGDLVLRNDKVAAVIAFPGQRRHANLMTNDVGGALIDLARVGSESDQLTAFYPGARPGTLTFAWAGSASVPGPIARLSRVSLESLRRTSVRARQVALAFTQAPADGRPGAEVVYSLSDGDGFVRVVTTIRDLDDRPSLVEPIDWLRIDQSQDGNSIERVADGEAALYWAHDRWFSQAYAVVSDGPLWLRHEPGRRAPTVLSHGVAVGAARRVPPGGLVIERKILVERDLLGVRAEAAVLAGVAQRRVVLSVEDPSTAPVTDADVEIMLAGRPYGHARTDARGRLQFRLPVGEEAIATVSARGHGQKRVLIRPDTVRVKVRLGAAGQLAIAIREKGGGLVPAKLQFFGRYGTYNPNFGPDHLEADVRNVHYASGTRVVRKFDPGQYDVIVSRGPEYDAVFTSFEVRPGATTSLEVELVRSVDTTGFISADFHSHSTESGDNTSSQRGRVLNLLAEHIEFAPCTEHNRVSSYDDHLRALGAQSFMATANGIELTGEPLPLNHQNAFPLKYIPNVQNGGGPWASPDPEIQIERLALWDDGAEKLVQQNHPDIGRLYFDRDNDGIPDQGFLRGVGFIDVIEVHPPDAIFWAPFSTVGPPRGIEGRTHENRMFDWMRVLNTGRRVPGVVNTDAHSNYQESGGLRNFIKSKTDKPEEIQTLDIVHAAERGNLIMTNGPFLEVRAWAAEGGEAQAVGPGDSLAARSGTVKLHVRAQAPNWFDLDRVQILVNGAYVPEHNYTRRTHAAHFGDGPLKFNQILTLTLTRDAYVIVAVTDEDQPLGKVAGHWHENDHPTAVSNPIYVDVGDDGFVPPGATSAIGRGIAPSASRKYHASRSRSIAR